MNNFEIKRKFDLIAYKAFNLYSQFRFYLDRDLKRELFNNRHYKNKHAGSRAFIIGTGPSIKYLGDDKIKLLQSEVVFAVNSYYKSEKLLKLIPTYYTLVDNHYWGLSKSAFGEIRSIYGRDPVFITDYRAKHAVPSDGDVIYLRSRNYPIDAVNYDLTKNSSISLNVVGTSIMCAMYMGFSEIYILGCDFNSFCSPSNSHCYDDSDERQLLKLYNLAFYLDQYAKTAEIHYLINRTAEINGINIYNATPNSLLDAYRMVDLNTIL